MSMPAMGIDALPATVTHAANQSPDKVLRDSFPFLLQEAYQFHSCLRLSSVHPPTQFIP